MTRNSRPPLRRLGAAPPLIEEIVLPARRRSRHLLVHPLLELGRLLDGHEAAHAVLAEAASWAQAIS
jgi:hypothetical protein